MISNCQALTLFAYKQNSLYSMVMRLCTKGVLIVQVTIIRPCTYIGKISQDTVSCIFILKWLIIIIDYGKIIVEIL